MTGTCLLNTSGFWNSTVTTQPKCRDKNVKPSHWLTISNDDNCGMLLDIIIIVKYSIDVPSSFLTMNSSRSIMGYKFWISQVLHFHVIWNALILLCLWYKEWDNLLTIMVRGQKCFVLFSLLKGRAMFKCEDVDARCATVPFDLIFASLLCLFGREFSRVGLI